MTDRIHCTYLYVSSKNSGQEASDFSLSVPPMSMTATPEQFIRLTMSQMSVINSLYNVESGSNSMYVLSTYPFNSIAMFNIQPGTYRVSDFVLAYNRLNTGTTMTYLPLRNKMNLANTTGSEVTVVFEKGLAEFVGANRSVPITLADSASVELPNMVIPCAVNDLVIHLSGVSIDPPTNLSNFESRDLNTSSIFAVVPLRARPHALNVWTNTSGTYTVDVYDTNIQRLVFWVTDSSGRVLSSLPHWTAVIKVEVITRPERDRVPDRLDKLVQLLRLFFMSWQLKQNRDLEDEDDDGDLEELGDE